MTIEGEPETLADYAIGQREGRVTLMLKAGEETLAAATTPELAREIGDALFREALAVGMIADRAR